VSSRSDGCAPQQQVLLQQPWQQEQQQWQQQQQGIYKEIGKSCRCQCLCKEGCIE
jgi:hypothetical protein